ncbi:uncharacterized protein LOC121787448 isoform X4 [Salvia splendens]|uniref:uncharacterized protein LOC121787448 isoform X4 n=1 Tax=Salvia splendens TaxID=180675 RepID=UPI001C28074F|nr:uncharacterized protein LOC121787448 isoform X4 [Salvia splendens]
MAALASSSSSSSSPLHLSAARLLNSSPLLSSKNAKAYRKKQKLKVGVRVRAASEGNSKGKDNGSVEEPSIPPPWGREEAQKESSAGVEIGSIFEYVNEKPVFGVLSSDSVLYAPVLGFFVFTGIPTSAFLWYKSVEAANKEAEEQDRRDGFM